MHFGKFALAASSIILITGCATNWHNPRIADKGIEKQQLVQADAYCTQASMGTAPIPQVSYNDVSPQTSYMSVSGNSNNMYMGNTYSNYSGSFTTMPSPGASFTGGMANGMNIGAAIAARNAQKKIYKACMYQLGWTDSG